MKPPFKGPSLFGLITPGGVIPGEPVKSRPEVSSTGFALALILLALTGSYAVAEKVRSWRDGADVMGQQQIMGCFVRYGYPLLGCPRKLVNG